MERSKNSSLGKAVSGDEGNLSCPEESGWTAYFEDFSHNNNTEQASCFSLGGSSLVSDAASCAAWKFSNQNHPSSVGRSSSNPPKKLSFKKSRTKQISEDDPLEDTASSPVNSPKIGGLNSAKMVSRKTDNQIDDSMNKGFTSEQYSEQQTDDKHEINFNEKNIGCSVLKKRGLCLVPLSMLVNYFG